MLRLISTNIRFENPDDGENNWPNRKPLMLEMFSQEDPCLIGTQEGRQPQLQNLNEGLERHNLIDQHREWITERMYPCIFSSEEVKILESGDIWLSETPEIAGSKSFDSMFPRLCTWIKGQKEAKEFYYFNLHLDHIKDSTRLAQAQVLIHQIQSKFDQDIPLIIAGDFNQCANSSLKEFILERLPKLRDPYSEFNQEERTTYHKFSGENTDGCRIDWFLVDEKLKVQDCRILDFNRNGSYPSDHFPVFCSIAL